MQTIYGQHFEKYHFRSSKEEDNLEWRELGNASW